MKLNTINHKDYINLILEEIDTNLLADIDEPMENGITYLQMAADGRTDELKPDSLQHAVKTLNDFLDLLKKLKNTGNDRRLLMAWHNIAVNS